MTTKGRYYCQLVILTKAEVIQHPGIVLPGFQLSLE